MITSREVRKTKEMTVLDKSEVERITKELKDVGISEYGLHRFTSKYLPYVIHPNEKIEAAVFGRRKESEGFFGFVEGLLVGTDKRVIFIDHRPGYTTMDEISYEVVTGVNVTNTPFYSSLTVFSKVANYKLSFANTNCVHRFAEYVEHRRLDTNEESSFEKEVPSYAVNINNKALDFLSNHETGVLSSIERTGAIDGSVVYYTVRNALIYFMTKVSTRKVDNILGNQHVAFTVFDESELQTAQLQGVVEQESNEQIKKDVATSIIHMRTYENGSHLPPIMRMGDDDNFATFRIIPTKFSFIDFKNR